MKSEFDLNNLTDLDVQILEEALSRRRLMKLCCDEFDKDYTQRCLSTAVSAGFKPGEIHALVAPNYRQSGKNIIDKLQRLHTKAVEDLKIWLYYADCSTVEEFYEKSEDIKKISFHKYDDVLRQLSYIQKIANKIQGQIK